MADARNRIEGPVHCDVIENDVAAGFRPLADFCCGHCSKVPSAAEVNDTAARLFTGGSYDEGGAVPQHVVLLLDENGTLLGMASVRPEGALQRLDPVPYLNGYGREKRFAGYTLADSETTLGEALIRAAVELVTPDGGEAPELQALVREDNAQSHRPLANIGFEQGVMERFQPQVQGLPEGMPADLFQVPAHFRITLPSGRVHVDEQEFWRRPAGRELAPLGREVYIGPSQHAKGAAQAPPLA